MNIILKAKGRGGVCLGLSAVVQAKSIKLAAELINRWKHNHVDRVMNLNFFIDMKNGAQY